MPYSAWRSRVGGRLARYADSPGSLADRKIMVYGKSIDPGGDGEIIAKRRNEVVGYDRLEAEVKWSGRGMSEYVHVNKKITARKEKSRGEQERCNTWQL